MAPVHPRELAAHESEAVHVSADAPIPEAAALRLLVAAVAGGEPASSFIEVRCLHPDRGPGPRAFVPVREPARIVELVARLRDRHDVLIGAAPRVRWAGTADAVERVWCLRVDCDTPASVTRLDQFRPQPSIVVRSGTDEHVHAYWPLRASLSPTWARAAMDRLAFALGSDAAITDEARVMRAPGGLNHKHDPPTPVVCVRLELESFACAEVVGGLPDRPTRRPQPRRVARSAVPPDATLEGLLATVRTARSGNRNSALHWAAHRLAEHAGEGLLDLDAGREALREAALDVGLGEAEVAATLRSSIERRSA